MQGRTKSYFILFLKVCDKPLREPFDDVESEIIGFRVAKGADEPSTPSEDKP